MLKHKKRKVENIKSLTIPRKYKWRRICKDGKKKRKKITLQKLEPAESFVAEENQRLSVATETSGGSELEIKWAEPTGVSFWRRKRHAPLNAAYRSSRLLLPLSSFIPDAAHQLF